MLTTDEARPSAVRAEPEPPHAPPPPAGTGTLVTYTVTTFLGAALLFLVEPMVAKMLLPLLGGSAAVWNTATVFFQAALLGGYAFAHLSLRRLGSRRQPVLQLVALALPLLVLPIAVPSGWHPPHDVGPATWTLLVLAVMVGLPFFMLSTVSPTIQRWFADTDHPRAHDPYFLYAAGNVGSLLALVSYPLLIEPALSLADQARIWAALYVLFIVLSAACALLLRRHRTATAAMAPATAASARAPLSNRTRLRWIFLAAVPSALMLGVTRHISTDVASMPLLWVLPLSLYLITFIVAFGRNPAGPVRISARALKLLVVPLALSFFGLVASLWVGLGLNLLVFFCAAMVAHGRLSGERPTADRLTEFYLLLSVGGVVGGILSALVAPIVFNTVLEYPIAIVLSLALLPASAFDGKPAALIRRLGVTRRDLVVVGVAIGVVAAAVAIRSSGTQQALTTSMIVAAVAAAAGYILCRTANGYAAVIGVVMAVGLLIPANATMYQHRTFFGVHRVYADQAHAGRHVLLNGTTVHGMEYFTGPNAHRPTTYYHPTGPIGQWFAAAPKAPQHLGVIGLGTGALAWYGRAGDRFTYYEIDQAVVDVADDPALFTFVDDSKAKVDVDVGDGRLELAATDTRYDALIVDAFSGDGIPAHLLTDQALALYLQRTTDHGSIVFHISNRYFDFSKVVGRLAAQHGLAAYIQVDPASPQQEAEGKLTSTWVVLGRTPADTRVAGDRRWVRLGPQPGTPLWTDDHSDLISVLR